MPRVGHSPVCRLCSWAGGCWLMPRTSEAEGRPERKGVLSRVARGGPGAGAGAGAPARPQRQGLVERMDSVAFSPPPPPERADGCCHTVSLGRKGQVVGEECAWAQGSWGRMA